jgi:hypothetical protein
LFSSAGILTGDSNLWYPAHMGIQYYLITQILFNKKKLHKNQIKILDKGIKKIITNPEIDLEKKEPKKYEYINSTLKNNFSYWKI